MTPLVERCVASQKALGYEFVQITLDNCYKGSKYVQEALAAKRWVKAADYLRIYYLNELGGIYLDTDVEMEPGKNFDDCLNCFPMFVGEEENGFVSNAIIGSEAGHPLLADYLGKVERNFRGDGELVYNSGMYLWTELTKQAEDVIRYNSDWFLPFNWQTGITKKTRNTRCVHHFAKSWV